MAVFKCKMCGGTVEFEPGASIGVCDSCGTKQTLPRLDDDRRANLYDRANHFRRSNEFDKAAGLYEQILNEDAMDAEAYWSLVLCRYGIEYVEDPATRRRVPTVNRAQFTSVFDDDNYRSALKYADSFQREIYENEAKAINDIQKGILTISQKEEPFDVFICYKETDKNGRRTPDSVLANDLYHQLTQEGFKVFFARITLEDKLGAAYEPYIFAALNSAKVMVVLGTRPEYFNAVWVKNEWSRYLALVKKSGGKKVLIPAYRDMDPYDLPEEFSHLQAQDMSRLGFMQDLIRGIKKIARSHEPKPTVVKETVITGGNTNVAPLLERAFLFLEDGEWDTANDYCERVLDTDPKNALAYLGKLLSELKARTREALKEQAEPFDTSKNYQKAIRFADADLKAELIACIEHINERNEAVRLDGVYTRASDIMSAARTEAEHKEAARLFGSIDAYRDSASRAQECYEKAEIARKDAIYRHALSQMNRDSIDDYKAAIVSFQSISGWKDADERILACQRKIREIKEKEEADRLERARRAEEERLEAARKAEEERLAAEKAAKKRKKVIKIAAPIVISCIVIFIVLKTVIIPSSKYNKANDLMEAGKYTEAISAFKELDGYKDSDDMIDECNTAILDIKYKDAIALMDAGDYESAYSILKQIGNTEVIAASKYDRAIAFIDSGDYEAAYMLLEGLNYKDSAAKLNAIKPQYYEMFSQKAEVGSYVFFGSYEQDNNTSNGKEDIMWLVLAKEDDRALLISRYALDCQPYNKPWADVTWEACSLRKWLNETFIDNAFTADEQNSIQSTMVAADKNPCYDTSPGNNTTDKVFLLSIEEANKYFASDRARACRATAYAKAQGAYAHPDNGNCWWWVRSPGIYSTHAASVYVGGAVHYSGRSVSIDYAAVRPVLWISLDASLD